MGWGEGLVKFLLYFIEGSHSLLEPKRDTERERTGRKRRREEKRGKEGRGGRRRKEEEREGGRRGGGGEGRGMRIRAINRPGDPGFSSVNWWVLASWDLWRCES